MSRRNVAKKKFPEVDPIYNSYLVSLLITRILKSGKKNLAQNIVVSAFEIIRAKTNQDPLVIFEKAIKNASPVVEVNEMMSHQYWMSTILLIQARSIIGKRLK
jgi:small subunit ribosomal protein S7